MTDIKLIAIDMDHTLLNDKGTAPENFTDQVHALKEKKASRWPSHRTTTLYIGRYVQSYRRRFDFRIW